MIWARVSRAPSHFKEPATSYASEDTLVSRYSHFCVVVSEGNLPCSVRSFGVPVQFRIVSISLASAYPIPFDTHRMIHVPSLLAVRRIEVGVMSWGVNPVLGTEHGLGVFLPRTGRHWVSIDQF